MPKLFVYITGLRGPEAQIWDEQRYANQKPVPTLALIKLAKDEHLIGLNALKERYPAGKPSYVSADAKPLADAGLIEVNLEVKNDKGEVMARSTDAGKAKAAEPAEAGKSTGNYRLAIFVSLTIVWAVINILFGMNSGTLIKSLCLRCLP